MPERGEYAIDPTGFTRTLREQRRTRIKGGLYHLNQVLMAYNSNRIEDSRSRSARHSRGSEKPSSASKSESFLEKPEHHQSFFPDIPTSPPFWRSAFRRRCRRFPSMLALLVPIGTEQ